MSTNSNNNERPFGFPTEEEFARMTAERFKQIRAQREQDLAEGEKVAQREFSEGSLGRVGAERSADVQDIIARRRAQADLSGEVLRGERVDPAEEAAQKALDIQSQTSLRQLRGQLGAQGIRGGANIQRQAEVLQGRNLAEAQLQAQLAQQRTSAQQAALSGLESSVVGAEASELARSQENQKRALQERLGRITLPQQFAQAGSLERAAASSEIRSAAQAQAQIAAQKESAETARISAEKDPPSGGKIICGELHRQGLISDEVYAGDLAYSVNVRPETKAGYIFLATPIVEMMRVSKVATVVTCFIASGWAQEMAYRTGYVSKGSIVGKALILAIEPLCNFVGKLRRLVGRV